MYATRPTQERTTKFAWTIPGRIVSRSRALKSSPIEKFDVDRVLFLAGMFHRSQICWRQAGSAKKIPMQDTPLAEGPIELLVEQWLSERGAMMDRPSRFRFSDSHKSVFVIELRDHGKIEHARRILSGEETELVHVQGKVVKEAAPYNPDWSYHLDPNSIEFFSNSVEVCDASICFVEENLDDVGGSTLPGSHWCPWSSRLVEEIKAE